MLGKLSPAGSRRCRDSVIHLLPPVFIKMGQHGLYIKSTTGHIFNFIYNCLHCYAQYCSHTAFSGGERRVLWTWLPLRNEIGRGLMPPEHGCQRWLKMVLKRVRYEMETSHEELAAPGHIQRNGRLTRVGFGREWIVSARWGMPMDWYSHLLGLYGPGEHRIWALHFAEFLFFPALSFSVIFKVTFK